MIVRAWSGLGLLLLFFAQTGEAQRRPAAKPAAGSAATVRSELAAVLLQARRYDEAAREYRVLLEREPRSISARLGLARALAWGKRPREAEQELRILSGQRPDDPEIEGMLRSVRESLEPRSREAAEWLAQRPNYVPYRRALARALVREGKARAALPHYEQLLKSDLSTALVREAAHAQVAAGEHARAEQLLRGAIERAPGDSVSRHTLASTLADARHYTPALAQYDTLIAWYGGPVLLLERAQLNVARRDLSAAEADANASIMAGASVGAYVLLGDLARWRGDFLAARFSYEHARNLNPNDVAIAAAFAQLARDERPVVAFIPMEDHAAGWQMQSGTVSDNIGITYATVGARRAAHLIHGITGSVELEARHLAEQSNALAVGITGFGLEFGLARELAHGPFLTRLNARGGGVYHSDGSTLTGALSAAGWYGPWALAVEHAVGPAYSSLLTAASIRSPDASGELLTETTTSVSIGGPLGSADAAVRVQGADISDDNRRSTIQAALRYPLTARVSAVYWGSALWFADRSELYWAPSSYVASAAGLEYARSKQRGLSFAARVLAGPARSVEEVVRAGERSDQVHTSLQVSGGLDVNYRSEVRDIGAAITYGSGRAGEYRRFEASVYARLPR
jgi:tetratricopeptide (TPR) repeat protein